MHLMTRQRCSARRPLAQQIKIKAALGLLLLCTLLAGCGERTHTDKVLPEWSRGQFLGETCRNAPVALAVMPTGERLTLAWPIRRPDNTEALHLVVLDGQGTVLVDDDLPFPVARPQDVQAVSTGDGGVHLTWLDDVGDIQSLFYVRLTAEGQPLGQVQVLSQPGILVRGYRIAAQTDGSLLAVWAERTGLMAAILSEQGKLVRYQPLPMADVSRPYVQIDGDGQAHLAWRKRVSSHLLEIYYAVLDTRRLEISPPVRLTAIVLHIGQTSESLQGPVLGLERGWVYVGWALEVPQGTNNKVSFVGFPPDRPEEWDLIQFTLPARYPPYYTESTGSFPYQRLAAPLSGLTSPPAYFYQTPAVAVGQADELPVVVGMWVSLWEKLYLQPALVILDEGQVKGYQVIAWSEHSALQPLAATDGQSNLYVLWLDPLAPRRYKVYMTTTAPSLRQVWDMVTAADRREAVVRLAGRLMRAIGLLPVGVMWMVMPMLWLIVAYFLGDGGDLRQPWGRVALLVTVGLHWAGKYLLTPRFSFLSYLPGLMGLPLVLSDWLPYVMPGLTLVMGLAVMRLVYLERQDYPTLAPAYLLAAAVDIMLSLEMYAQAFPW